MYFSKKYIGKNKINFAIIIFLIVFISFHFFKPSLVYNPNGSFRNFGLGFKNKTVIPIWLVSIIFAIFSYLLILQYLAYDGRS
jgi:hypothetical protein